MEVTGGRTLTLDQRIGNDASVSKEDLREIGKRVGSRLTNEAGFGSLRSATQEWALDTPSQ